MIMGLLAIATCCLMMAIGLAACIKPQRIAYEEPKGTRAIEYDVEIRLVPTEDKATGTARFVYEATADGVDVVRLRSEAAVTKARVNGEDVRVNPMDVYTLLALPTEMRKGETIEVEVDFEMPCAQKGDRRMVKGLPVVCQAVDEAGERCEVTDGTIRLRIEAPKSQVLVMNGRDLTREYGENAQTVGVMVNAKDGFVLLASPYLVRKTATVGDTTWEYYAETVDALTYQTIGAVAEKARELWGDCGERRVAVVENLDEDVKGLTGINAKNLRDITEIIVGQWGKVTGDERVSGGLAKYTLWEDSRAYDEDEANRLLKEAKEHVHEYGVLHQGKEDEAKADEERKAYAHILADEGLLFWVNLREIGGDGIGESVQTIRKRGEVTEEVAVNIVREITGKDYGYYFEAWRERKVPICA